MALTGVAALVKGRDLIGKDRINLGKIGIKHHILPDMNGILIPVMISGGDAHTALVWTVD